MDQVGSQPPALSNIEESWSTRKEVIPKADIVSEAWRRVGAARSKEMRRGYFNVKVDKLGNQSKIWIPDTREEYFSAVEQFDVLLEAESKYEKNLTPVVKTLYVDKRKKILAKKAAAFRRWGWKTYTIKVIKANKNVSLYDKYIKVFDGAVTMPEASQERDVSTGAYAMVWDTDFKGKKYWRSWDYEQNQFVQELILIYDELMRALGILLYNYDYLKKKAKHG